MPRALRLIAHNWPLKLAAVALSIVLYVGLIVSSSARLFEVSVPIEAVGASPEVTILSDLGAVRQIRYFAPADLGLRLDSASFRATVNLESVSPSGGRATVSVQVTATDPRVQVLDFEPRQISVQLDAVVTRHVPVRVVLGPAPSGLELGEPTVSVTSVLVTGPRSIVDRVAEAQARVALDASGIDINRNVDLLPVDAGGEALSPVDLEPAIVRVRLAIFTDRQTRSLPIRPTVVGTPAAGFEIASVTTDPLVATVQGDIDNLAPLLFVDTAPVTLTGASSDVELDVALALPDGVQAPGVATVHVIVTLRPVTATRTFQAGLLVVGARADRSYNLSIDRVLITIGGPLADLDRLSGSTVAVTLDVSGLDSGSHEVAVTANLQTGLILVGASPDQVTVTITALPASSSPGP